jgi:hypothetical protein
MSVSGVSTTESIKKNSDILAVQRRLDNSFGLDPDRFKHDGISSDKDTMKRCFNDAITYSEVFKKSKRD